MTERHIRILDDWFREVSLRAWASCSLRNMRSVSRRASYLVRIAPQVMVDYVKTLRTAKLNIRRIEKQLGYRPNRRHAMTFLRDFYTNLG